MIDLTENELIDLEGIVTNERSWQLLKKIFKGQIADFWDTLRLTDPADEKRVSANHKLAVGVEASLGAIVAEMEDTINRRRYKENDNPVVLPDATKALFR
jgi:hypothetical protein